VKKHQDNITLFRSLFKGREDVFAIRWEKAYKSGYMPAMFYDPYRLRVHKMNGGTFQKNHIYNLGLQTCYAQIVISFNM